MFLPNILPLNALSFAPSLLLMNAGDPVTFVCFRESSRMVKASLALHGKVILCLNSLVIKFLAALSVCGKMLIFSSYFVHNFI